MEVNKKKLKLLEEIVLALVAHYTEHSHPEWDSDYGSAVVTYHDPVYQLVQAYREIGDPLCS